MPTSLPSRRTRPRPLRAGWVLLPLLLVACTGSDGRDLPEVDQFADGTCREAAPDVLAVDEQTRATLEDGVDLEQVRQALREHQVRLQALSSGEDEVALALSELVGKVGFVRIAVDADALEEAEVTEVSDAVDAVVALCVPSDE